MKILSILLALFLTTITPIHASENSGVILNNEKNQIILTDQYGNEQCSLGKEVQDLHIRTVAGHSRTFEYTLRAQNGTLTTNETDGSIAVRAYLTINYTTDGEFTKLTSVSGKWTFLDSGMSVTSAVLVYGSNGLTNDGSSISSQVATKYVSNNFSYSTGFTKGIHSSMGVVGSNLTLGLKQTNPNGTSRTWTFKTQNNLFNSGFPID